MMTTRGPLSLTALFPLLLGACAGAGELMSGPRAAEAPAARGSAEASYWIYVGAESADLMHRIRFGPDGASVEKTIPIGRYPTEVEGPHGIAISPDGRHLYLTTGHGVPSGMIWKYELGPDTLVGREIPLGNFPATLDVTPDGLFAFVVNFNLHGDHVPSDISVVYTPDMVEVARTPTCTMPHGSRINPAGTRHYSACMMDDRLVELDTRAFGVARQFGVAVGAEGPVATPADEHAGHGMTPSCSPTWAEPSADGTKVYVACNKADHILEIDVQRWEVTRTLPAGRSPYNLEATADGRLLIATLKAGAAVQFFDLDAGRALATTPSTTTVTHGVVASPDSRYAFVSVEGVGAEPGKVDIYDLRSFRLVASVDVGQQAGGIGFWKMEAR
ncbi:MAG TPA: YncE family protein [Longimicrobiales bacterium]|nr:YncE family protein [Longimicrobiales bacterium]